MHQKKQKQGCLENPDSELHVYIYVNSMNVGPIIQSNMY